MTIFDAQGRPEPPVSGDETAMLLGFLDFHRATLAWKVDGLGADGLDRTAAASAMTLGGMLKHLAYVELSWFAGFLFDRPLGEPWDSVDWGADYDWDWHSAADDAPEALLALWRGSVDRARALTDEALADGGLDRLADRGWQDGRTPSLRWILVHMIEEYARHNGHADLIREAIDGATGE
ncbi:DinB family protein [Glycomyces sp. A-F 0318]|uniref:DinB family protein n=1 Tax=Glycomyces amatae TaxID=2881355 RepID=UPI001E2C0DCD|nr:DinB family protein [Glycomyces amatae]MCD0442950.1 DinB family protein [Glycomyces amatae]